MLKHTLDNHMTSSKLSFHERTQSDTLCLAEKYLIFNSYYPDMGEWTEGQAYAARGRRLRAA